MKVSLLTGLLLSCYCIAYGQNQQTLPQKIQYLYAPIDKSQLHSGYLFDLIVPICSPQDYMGLDSSGNVTDLNAFGCIYGELYGSYALPGSNPLPSPRIYLDKQKNWRAGDAIPVAVMSWQFDQS